MDRAGHRRDACEPLLHHGEVLPVVRGTGIVLCEQEEGDVDAWVGAAVLLKHAHDGLQTL